MNRAEKSRKIAFENNGSVVEETLKEIYSRIDIAALEGKFSIDCTSGPIAASAFSSPTQISIAGKIKEILIANGYKISYNMFTVIISW